MKKLIGVVFALGICPFVWAQEEVQYNPNSIEPIAKYEHLYKRRVWREINLKEKKNKGFFAKNGEITKLIVEAVKSGQIASVYKSDSLDFTYTKDNFLAGLSNDTGDKLTAWDPTKTYYYGDGSVPPDAVSFNGKNYEVTKDDVTGVNPETSITANDGIWVVTTRGVATEFDTRADFTLITLMEDVIFDKRRSRLYYDLQAIELRVFTGVYWKSAGWFKYKDLEKVFRANPEKAIWFNSQNTAENKNFADAFKLRFFYGPIVKIENPDNETIAEMYGNQPYPERIWAREWEEMKLMEKEHNLWEF